MKYATAKIPAPDLQIFLDNNPKLRIVEMHASAWTYPKDVSKEGQEVTEWTLVLLGARYTYTGEQNAEPAFGPVPAKQA